MSKEKIGLNRRRFLKTAVQAGVGLAVPQIIPGAALGKNGSVAPSERITLGAIGIGNRGRYVLGCFLQEHDLKCVAVCDVRGDNRKRAKDMVDTRNGNKDCKTYIDMRELLARDDIGRQRRLLRKALYEEHRPEPVAGGCLSPHGPRVPGRHATSQPTKLRLCN